MRLDVIINTFNRKDILIKTLKAFALQSYKDFELIIADDGSTDGTKQAIEELNSPFKIRYFFQENSGAPASPRNLGLKNSKSEIILFLGDDIIPSKDLLKEHIKAHQVDKEELVVLGYTKWASQIKMTPFRKYLTNYHFSYDNIIDKENVHWGYFYTSNVSIRRSFLEKVGLFDENLFYAYEDAEFGYRAFLKGMRMVFNEKAVGYHNHPVDFRGYQKAMFNRGAAAVALGQKVPPLEYKANYKETNNPIRLFFKKIVFNNFITPITVEVINILDKLFIPLPQSVYYKIMDYHRVKGIKELR